MAMLLTPASKDRSFAQAAGKLQKYYVFRVANEIRYYYSY